MSIIRPPVKRRSGRILTGLAAAAIAAAALAPAATSATQHHLVFKLSGSSHQNMVDAEAIVIAAHCPTEACTVVAAATSTSPSIHTARVRAHVPAGTTEQLLLPLAPRQSAKLKAAVKAGKPPTLTVHATAHDSAGNNVPLTLLVHSNKA
jgi:hypothetical protein